MVVADVAVLLFSVWGFTFSEIKEDFQMYSVFSFWFCVRIMFRLYYQISSYWSKLQSESGHDIMTNFLDMRPHTVYTLCTFERLSANILKDLEIMPFNIWHFHRCSGENVKAAPCSAVGGYCSVSTNGPIGNVASNLSSVLHREYVRFI